MVTLVGSFPLSIVCSSSKHETPTYAFKLLFRNVCPIFTNSRKIELSSERNPWRRSTIRAHDKDRMEESMDIFMEEDGSVKDMDGYLNALSLEYDSVWDTKPAWCQPWTIGLTGVLAVCATWIFFHSVILTAVVVSLVGVWWYIFLFSYPQAYAEMIAERRNKVKSGHEDTYGAKKVQ